MIRLTSDTMDRVFTSDTLILPSVAVGNVGQLTMDLILNNLQPAPKKIGTIFHDALEPVVGTAIDQNGKIGLMTPCEVFQHEDKNMVLLQFHSPVSMKGREEFVSFLLSWMEQKKFKQVICLSSTFSEERIDVQLSGSLFRFLTTPESSESLKSEFLKLGCKALESRSFPAPAVLGSELEEKLDESSADKVYIPGGGIAKLLHDQCTSRNIPLFTLMMFASDGDNTPEAMTMFETINETLGITEKGAETEVRIPTSWNHLFGGPQPGEMF